MIGGVGWFLLGMTVMTEGLKALAAPCCARCGARRRPWSYGRGRQLLKARTLPPNHGVRKLNELTSKPEHPFGAGPGGRRGDKGRIAKTGTPWHTPLN
jgi:hypothetical protein